MIQTEYDPDSGLDFLRTAARKSYLLERDTASLPPWSEQDSIGFGPVILQHVLLLQPVDKRPLQTSRRGYMII